MNQPLHDRIREILETTPGLTQKGLAERMGLNPAAINRMLYGRRNIMADEIPVIEDYLGTHLLLSPSAPAPRAQGTPDTQTVPVYSYADGTKLSSHRVIDTAPRHPAQAGVPNAFAIYVAGEDMTPRYYPGELVYIHPGRLPENHRDCIVELKNGDAHLCRFLRAMEGKIRVAQLNPSREADIARDAIKALYSVVGRG
jgi:SOS-response transcriptional repressor LexA